MRRLLIVLTTCALANAIGTMLVQGRSDTIRTLRDIVRHSSKPVHSTSNRKLDHRNPDSSTLPFIPKVIHNHQKISSNRESKKRNIRFLGKVRARRHIGNVVVESGQCDHVDLMDCSDFETDEMTCMLTATGMTCCVCTGLLRAAKRSLF
uniref:Secreted protein n=1 Tax=Caenorhabditis tropicalis TaxID=1561998 RepID=A0A1I7TDU1_9PELO